MSDDIFFEDGKSLRRICTDAAPGISIHKEYGVMIIRKARCLRRKAEAFP